MSTPRRIVTILTFVIGGACLIAHSAEAATKTWTGLGADANWTTAANWSPSGAPMAGDDLVFPAGASRLSNNNDTTAGTSYNTLSITGPAGGYILSGNAIQLAAGLTAENSAANTVALPITLTASQTFTVSGDRLRLNGPIDLGPNILTVATGSTGIVEVNATISGTGGLTYTGSATSALSINAAATYSGPTNILSGSFSVTGANGGALNPASVVTLTGGVLQFNNGGSAGPVTAIGGKIVLGNGLFSEVGSVTSLTAESGSQLEFDMFSFMGVMQPATLNVSGGVTLNDPTLLVTWGFTSSLGDSFTILNKTSAGPISGTFSGLPEGAIFSSNGRSYRITYVGGDGNDVVITDIGGVTPTPTVTPTAVSTATPTATPTGAAASPAVPTLGAGGLAALVGLLALTALFVLRRSV